MPSTTASRYRVPAETRLRGCSMTGPPVNGLRRRVLLRDVARRGQRLGLDRVTGPGRRPADQPGHTPESSRAPRPSSSTSRTPPRAASGCVTPRRSACSSRTSSDPVHGQIASGFEDEASRSGYCVIMVAGDDTPTRERLALKVFAEHGADGVAIVSSAISPREGRERVDPARLVLVQPDHRSLPRRDGPASPGVILTDDASRRSCRGRTTSSTAAIAGSPTSRARAAPRTRSGRRPSRPRSGAAGSAPRRRSSRPPTTPGGSRVRWRRRSRPICPRPWSATTTSWRWR